MWPPAWAGQWRAGDGKTVTIDVVDGQPLVTVAPSPDGVPYRSAELLEGGYKAIERLPATVIVDSDGGYNLDVDAGTPGLGPTYRLTAVVPDGDLVQRADPDAPPHRLVLLPSTGLGLYDDYEDDLGAPWAYPLEPLLPVVTSGE